MAYNIRSLDTMILGFARNNYPVFLFYVPLQSLLGLTGQMGGWATWLRSTTLNFESCDSNRFSFRCEYKCEKRGL